MRRWAALCSLPLAYACSDADDPTLTAPREVASVAAAVVGGESIEACNWPSTVSVNAWGSCSGTLIHPRVVTTAAHCISGGETTIFFGSGRNSPGSFSLPATCKTGAQGARGANTGADWAYCILPDDARVREIPVTPPLVGCEADKYLRAGMQAWVVGFGTTSSQGFGAGIKRQVPVIINALNKPTLGTIDVGDATQGACHGDSGGPLYVHLRDGAHDWGYRVVGSTSGAGESLCDCTCSTVYVNIANHVKMIEANENIDVTPCTDARGAFEPSAACNTLETAVQDGSGVFPTCTGSVMREPMNSCAAISAPTGGMGTRTLSAAGGPALPVAANGATMPGSSKAGAGGAAGFGGAGAGGAAPSSSSSVPGPSVPSSPTGTGASAILGVPGSGLPAGGGSALTGSGSSSASKASTNASDRTLNCQTASVGVSRAGHSAWPAALALIASFGFRMRRRGGAR